MLNSCGDSMSSVVSDENATELKRCKQPITPPEDSGNDSYLESPVAEEESDISEHTMLCDSDMRMSDIKSKNLQHILDKSFSLDDTVLDKPLSPSKYSFTAKNETLVPSVDLRAPSREKHPCSILRRGSCYENKSNTSLDSYQSLTSLRRVSFASENFETIDPGGEVCIEYSIKDTEELLQIYEQSCKRNKTIELDDIKFQIPEIKDNTNHSATLNLSSINLTNEVIETLEDLLKVSTFQKIILSDCKFCNDTISELFNMVGYYESTKELEIAVKFENEEAWQTFCDVCSEMEVLETLTFKGIQIGESYMRSFLHAIKSNPNIITLRFDGCELDMIPTFYLVELLKSNSRIQELYLPSCKLYAREAQCLGNFLQINSYLRVLDISNNYIGDRGLESLAKGLTKQTVPGLSVLVIFNNQLTEKSSAVIYNIIKCCQNLQTLNVGYNNLTDEVLTEMKGGLAETKSLEGLGLQCTLLTCKGISDLADAIQCNTSLQKINLKGNKAIQVAGLNKLCNALTNSKITKIEIDEINRSCSDPLGYTQLVKKLNAICTVNKNFIDSKNEDISNIANMYSRKVSLNCEPRFNLPDIKRTLETSLSTTTTKSRFQIVPVPEGRINILSRFKVTPVAKSPDDEDLRGCFANVRSSVSSNDSTDSLMAHPELVDSDNSE